MKRTDFLRALRFAAVAVPLSALSGCALPPIITVVSIAADFASYGETGKTVSDNALSLVTRKDCAMFRAVDNKPICVENVEVAASSESNGRLRIAGTPAAPLPVAPIWLGCKCQVLSRARFGRRPWLSGKGKVGRKTV